MKSFVWVTYLGNSMAYIFKYNNDKGHPHFFFATRNILNFYLKRIDLFLSFKQNILQGGCCCNMNPRFQSKFA